MRRMKEHVRASAAFSCSRAALQYVPRHRDPPEMISNQNTPNPNHDIRMPSDPRGCERTHHARPYRGASRCATPESHLSDHSLRAARETHSCFRRLFLLTRGASIRAEAP
jgi:hypothetical protein